jgi:hypothetical protein
MLSEKNGWFVENGSKNSIIFYTINYFFENNCYKFTEV